MGEDERAANARRTDWPKSPGSCVCGAVRFEIDVPAVWAWHDHSPASRHAQGCAYATYIGSWKSRFRLLEGADQVSRYEDPESHTVRSFCALFAERTGREPRYHTSMSQAADWTYLGEALMPLKGYPGVLIERPRKKKPRPEGMF
jgi:hypothetical protein